MPPLTELSSKPPGYYGASRSELIDDLDPPLGRVLDIGCGEGANNEAIRAAGGHWVAGVELLADPAEIAAGRYDRVEQGDALAALARLDEPFDTILCYDVLEHLTDPAGLLRGLRRLAREGGRLHISIPNARHYSLTRDLVFRGTFAYAEYGHRDATHLRWFTRRDIVDLLSDAGWKVESTTPSLEHWLRRRRVRVPGRVARGLGEFFAVQWFVLARAVAR